ncbi:MAG: DMT family transporter [Thermoleophilia bacterium]
MAHEHDTERPPQDRLGGLALAALALIWGSAWSLTKYGLAYVEPYTFAAVRSVLSVACLFILVLILRRPLRPVALGLTTIIGLLQTSGFVALTMWSLYHSGAGRTSVLTYTMPFWLLLLAWIVLGERLHRWQWLAVILALCGLVLVIQPWQLNGIAASLTAVAGGFVWATSAIVAKVLHRHHRVDDLSLTAWQMLLGTPVLIFIAVLTYTGPPEWTAGLVGVLAFNVVLANGVAWALWLFALRTLSAAGAGLGTLAVPVVGVLTAWVQLGERPGAVEGAGMALIIAALALLSTREIIVTRLRQRSQ